LLFDAVKNAKLTEEQAAQARPLLGCWYYTAMECNFDESEEAEAIEDEEGCRLEAVAGLGGVLSMLMGAAPIGDDDDDDAYEEGEEEGDEDEEEEVEEEEEQKPTSRRGVPAGGIRGRKSGGVGGGVGGGGSLYLRMRGKKKQEEKEAADEEEEEEEAEEKEVAPEVKSETPQKGTATKKGVRFSPEAMEPPKKAKKEVKEEEDQEEEEEAADPFAETADAKAIRESILAAVGDLHCYFPSPQQDMLFFKRMLVNASRRDEAEVSRWFPWGQPPLQRLMDVHRSAADRPQLQAYTAPLLELFAGKQGK
jgi:chemotaxis protein histidine kinase CheA